MPLRRDRYRDAQSLDAINVKFYAFCALMMFLV